MVDILISIAAKVAEYTVVPIGRRLGYLLSYKKNVDHLNTKIVDLKNVKQRLQLEVDEAQRKGENIFDDVNDWCIKVDNFITEVHGNFTPHEEQANAKCIWGPNFPNLVSRYRLSRRAKKMAENVVTQIQDGEKIKQVSYFPNLPSSVENRGIYEEFESRNPISTDVIKALRDPSVSMVGVWGMGGAGKTMLAKEVARRAKDEEKIFDTVVFTTISNDPNIEKVQQEIGEKLGMQLHEVTKDVRAERLRNRLRQENKILIIVDDIWDQLDLEDVGISFGINEKGCKILLTTRSYHVLANDMGVDTNVIFAVGDLLEHEAMSLFRKIVGDQAEKHDDFQGLAVEIVKECGGLPIAITTVASALKNKGCAVWKNALQELKNSNPINIKGMHHKVYTSIKLSYDALESEEAKLLLLLCGLFEEDANIHVEKELCKYGIGLNLFGGVNTLEEARNKTVTLVTNLKHHSLLLGGDDDSDTGRDHVKLHDVIRDVVIFIAHTSHDHHRMHNVRNAHELEKYVNEEMFEDSTAISMYDIKADQCPQTLKIPELNLLRLVCRYDEKDSGKLPHQVLEGLNKLLVLDSVRVPLEQLPPAASSFCLLPKLQTLRLTECNLGDISWIGELKDLKILDLSIDSSITKLPRGMGKLNRLLSLSVKWCSNLKVIEPNVISSLTRLEELNLNGSCPNWEFEGVANGDERQNANLSEVKNLPHLIDLTLQVPDIKSVPKDMFSAQLKKYNIIIGSGPSPYFNIEVDRYEMMENTSRMLKLTLCPNSVLNEHDFEALLKTSETLSLKGLKSVKSIAFEIDSTGLKHLKHLTVQESTKIQSIVNSNDGNTVYQPAAFPSLVSLFLRRLTNLESIIHGKLTAETSFGKLREIAVCDCDKMKSLFSLYNIPKQLEEITVEHCEMMEEIISDHGREGDRVEKIELSQLQSLRLLHLPKLVQFIATSKSHGLSEGQVVFAKLKILKLVDLPNLERFCEGHISFPKLDSLKLYHLPNLKRFCGGDYIDCPSLLDLCITNCPKLRVFMISTMPMTATENQDENSTGLVDKQHLSHLKVVFAKLKFLKLDNLPNLEKFCECHISFPKLETLVLSNLPNLESFCGRECVDCPSLLVLRIRDCPKLRVSMTSTMSTTTTENQDENSTGLVDKQHLSHLKGVVKVELSTEPSCSEITCQHDPLGCVEEHDAMVFKTKRLSQLSLWNFPNLHHLPKTSQTVERLSICAWGIRLKDLATPLMSFQNLKYLMVEKCHGLTSLLSPSTAQSLSQLTHLGISDCKSLRQVIANDNKEAHDHEIIADNTNIIFSQLKSLLLVDLSNLTSFYSGNNNVVLQFPYLDEFIVGDCPEIKTFYHGNIDCPSLHHIFLRESIPSYKVKVMWDDDFYGGMGKGKYIWKHDINTTIQTLWEYKESKRFTGK